MAACSSPVGRAAPITSARKLSSSASDKDFSKLQRPHLVLTQVLQSGPWPMHSVMHFLMVHATLSPKQKAHPRPMPRSLIKQSMAHCFLFPAPKHFVPQYLREARSSQQPPALDDTGATSVSVFGVSSSSFFNSSACSGACGSRPREKIASSAISVSLPALYAPPQVPQLLVMQLVQPGAVMPAPHCVRHERYAQTTPFPRHAAQDGRMK
mmetsp:Transcript_132866/g.187691  ORF Transcript_132866/g.187691 Transcript_132866/m.187691 type:complete len:210 (-) Transcript_132866:221-850(-)